jgi:hypothetical protein
VRGGRQRCYVVVGADQQPGWPLPLQPVV